MESLPDDLPFGVRERLKAGIVPARADVPACNKLAETHELFVVERNLGVCHRAASNQRHRTEARSSFMSTSHSSQDRQADAIHQRDLIVHARLTQVFFVRDFGRAL